MKYQGASTYDFTPNLSHNQVGYATDPPYDLRLARAETVYARSVIARYSASGTWLACLQANQAATTVYAGDSGGRVAFAGASWSGTYYYQYQTHYVFDTSFIGASATIIAATLTVSNRYEFLPRNDTLNQYVNFYAWASEWMPTRDASGNPINVPADGSGFAARLGPYSQSNVHGVYRGWDGFDAYVTVPLSVSAINKVGDTRLQAVSQAAITGTYQVGYLLVGANLACITVVYLP